MAVRWGVLGTATIANKVGKALQQAAGSEWRAVASRDEAKARAWGGERGVPRCYGDYQQLLDDPEIDAVYIPLPPHLHREWVGRAAAAGKHVLCDKPIALDADDARAVLQSCADADVRFMDAVMWVHHPRAAEMKRRMAAGELGALKRLTAAFSFPLPSPEPGAAPNIRWRAEMGGGALGDLGVYCIRAALWAFDAMPERVWATARLRHGVDDHLQAVLWFPGGRLCSFDCAFDTTLRQWLEVAGDRATLVCDDFVLPTAEVARYWLHDSDEKSHKHEIAPVVQEVRMVEDFCELVRGGGDPASWPRASLAMTIVTDALRQSFQTGKEVDVPPLD